MGEKHLSNLQMRIKDMEKVECEQIVQSVEQNNTRRNRWENSLMPINEFLSV